MQFILYGCVVPPGSTPMGEGALGRSRVYRLAFDAKEKQQCVDADRGADPFVYFRQWEAGPEGPGRLVIFPLSGASRFTLGRGPANDISLADPAVSLVHAELRKVGGEWVIEDDGLSTNGTFVKELPAGDFARVGGRRRLHDQCEIRVGDTELIFVVPLTDKSPAETRSPAGSTASLRPVTPAQRRVLVRLCEPAFRGSSALPPTNEEIASSSLHLSKETVKSHLRALYRVFDLDDEPPSSKRAMLIDIAIESGVVTKADYGMA